jgi:hypothetical protein
MDKKPTFSNQIIAGTREDKHGERYSKEFFEKLLATIPKRTPLNVGHEMGIPTAGYLENFKLVQNTDSPEEWNVTADIYVTDGELDIGGALKGFSFSATSIDWGNTSSPEEILFLPYPIYNDLEFIGDLVNSSDDLAVGKWIKKSVDPVLIGMAITAFAVVIGPEWDIQYKNRIRPKLIDIISRLPTLNKKGISLDIVQRFIGYCDEEIQMYFIPDRSNELESHTENNIKKGLNIALSTISRDSKAKSVGVKRIELKFNPETHKFDVFRILYLDGVDKHAT